jgi:hypothetical protein
MKVLAIVIAVSNISSAQDRKKDRSRPKQTVLRQLHPGLAESNPPEGIRLLSGYKHKGAKDFEGNQVGEISKSHGFKITYEMGFSQGLAVDPDRKAAYIWYKEQKVDGRIIRYALSKGNVLMISVALDDAPNTLYAANFYGVIRRSEDIADMFLTILPFVHREDSID